MRKIILDQFAWLPISSKKLSNYIVLTYDSLVEFFENGSLEFSSICISESSLKAKASETVNEFIREKKLSNLKAVYDQICDKVENLPLLDEVLNATRSEPLDWNPVLPKAPDQSDESHAEQVAALEIGIRKIKDKLNGISTNHYCLAGPPGSGKSLLSKILFVYTISLGLNTVIILVLSE